MRMAGKNGVDGNGKTSNDNELRERHPVRYSRHTIRHSCHPVRYARCPLSVIPAVFNRESRIFPGRGIRMQGQKKKAVDSR